MASNFEAKWSNDIKNFKKYMKEYKIAATDFTKPFTDFGKYLKDETKSQIKAEQSPTGTPWLPLAPATILQKRTRLKLRETYKMTRSLFYKVSKIELEFGISDPKYVYHHYGTKKMPARVIVGVDTPTRMKFLNKRITVYLKNIKPKSSI